MVNIKAKTLTQKVYEVSINSGSSVLELKNELSKVMDNKIHEYDYKLILLGKVLDDTEVINDDHESKLFIIMTTKKKVIEQPKVEEPKAAEPPVQENNLEMNVNNLNLVNTLMNQLNGQLGGQLNGQDNMLTNMLVNIINNLNVNNNQLDENEDEEEEENEDNENNDDEEDNQPVNNNFNSAMIGDFTDNQVDEVNELVSMGFDYMEVFQMYLATGKNKEATLNILLG